MDATVFVENLTEEQRVSLQDVYQKAAEGQPEETSFGTLHNYPNSGKKKGRKPKEAISEDAHAMDLVAQSAQNTLIERQKINEQFLEDGETYNLHICIEKARMYQEQMSDGMMGLGAQLLLIKHNEVEHGNFFAVVEKLGLSWRAANYAMAAARKFGSNSHTCANLGNAKIRALTVLDDDSIKNLEDGGVLVGVGTLDDIERMTVRELKAALREEKKKRKEERDAQEAAISQKEKKLNELEMELRYREPPTKEQLAQAALDEKRKPLFTAIMSGIEDLSVATDRILDICRIDNVQIDQLTRLARSFDSEMSLLKERLDELDETLNAACPIKEDVPCMSNTQSK